MARKLAQEVIDWVEEHEQVEEYVKGLIEREGVAPGKYYRQQTRPGAVWMITRADSNDSPAIGYFTVGDRAARAVIPK